MTHWDPAYHRYELWLELRELAADIQRLVDRWAHHDPDLATIRDVLERPPPEPTDTPLPKAHRDQDPSA